MRCKYCGDAEFSHPIPQLLREFADSDGVRWRVWDVRPIVHERTSSSLRTSGLLRIPDGWLCFESETERRRLSPIPEDWETVDEPGLLAYWMSARIAPIARDFEGGDAARD